MGMQSATSEEGGRGMKKFHGMINSVMLSETWTDRQKRGRQTDRRIERMMERMGGWGGGGGGRATTGRVTERLKDREWMDLMVQLLVILGGGGISSSWSRMGPPAGR